MILVFTPDVYEYHHQHQHHLQCGGVKMCSLTFQAPKLAKIITLKITPIKLFHNLAASLFFFFNKEYLRDSQRKKSTAS